MCCLRLVLWSGIVSCVSWVGTLNGQTLQVLNGSVTNVLEVVTDVGVCRAVSGQGFAWSVSSGAWVSNVVDGVVVSSFAAQPGHDYRVLLGGAGVVSCVDESAVQTYWFWYGFAFSMCAGFMALGARWVRRILAGGSHTEGLNE